MKRVDLGLNTIIEGKSLCFSGYPVQLTWINGIKNTQQDIIRSGLKISEIMKGAALHCIGDPTQGVVTDVFRAAFLTVGETRLEIVERCVATWATLINELDRKFPGQEGRIVHIAHSRGGIVTQRAIDRLDELSRSNLEYKGIKSRLSLYFFGSPGVVADSGVDATYYVQDSPIGDPIPYAISFKSDLHVKTGQTKVCLPSEGAMKHGILGSVYLRQLGCLGELASSTQTRSALQKKPSDFGLRRRDTSNK